MHYLDCLNKHQESWPPFKTCGKVIAVIVNGSIRVIRFAQCQSADTWRLSMTIKMQSGCSSHFTSPRRSFSLGFSFMRSDRFLCNYIIPGRSWIVIQWVWFRSYNKGRITGEVVEQWSHWTTDQITTSQDLQAATTGPLSKALNPEILSCINKINVSHSR